MNLAAFRIQDIRCFADSGWVQIDSISVFVGENDSGKTTALDAISAALGLGSLKAADIRRTPEIAPVGRVSLKFRLSPTEQAALPVQAPRSWQRDHHRVGGSARGGEPVAL